MKQTKAVGFGDRRCCCFLPCRIYTGSGPSSLSRSSLSILCRRRLGPASSARASGQGCRSPPAREAPVRPSLPPHLLPLHPPAGARVGPVAHVSAGERRRGGPWRPGTATPSARPPPAWCPSARPPNSVATPARRRRLSLAPISLCLAAHGSRSGDPTTGSGASVDGSVDLPTRSRAGAGVAVATSPRPADSDGLVVCSGRGESHAIITTTSRYHFRSSTPRIYTARSGS